MYERAKLALPDQASPAPHVKFDKNCWFLVRDWCLM